MSTNNDIKHYSAEDISRYWQGKLSGEEMNAMERAAMDDPFLADAMEGYSNASPQNVRNDLAELEQRLQEKAAGGRLVPMRKNKWLRVAAVIILIGGASALTYQFVQNNNSHENLVQASKQEAPAATEQKATAIAPVTDSSPGIQNKAIVSDTLVENRAFLSTSDGAAKPLTQQKNEDDRFSASERAELKTVPDLSLYKKTPDSLNFATAVKEGASRDSLLVGANDANANRNARSLGRADGIQGNAPSNQSNQPVPNRDNNRYYSNNFSGRVMDADNNAIPQASLRVNNSNQQAVTDNNGFFQIRSGDTVMDLSVTSVGFQSRQLTLRSNQPSDVVLEPAQSKLKEVVVAGTGKKTSAAKSKDDKSTLKVYPMEAEPVIGWDEFNNYLIKNNRVTTAGGERTSEAVISFTVGKNGKLSSFDIEKSAGKQQDAEAIRLIKEGPGWKLLKGKKTKARVIVGF